MERCLIEIQTYRMLSAINLIAALLKRNLHNK